MREHVERLKAMLYASGLVAVGVQRFGEVYRATLHRPARIGGYPGINTVEWHPAAPMLRLMRMGGVQPSPSAVVSVCEVHGFPVEFESRSPLGFG